MVVAFLQYSMMMMMMNSGLTMPQPLPVICVKMVTILTCFCNETAIMISHTCMKLGIPMSYTL